MTRQGGRWEPSPRKPQDQLPLASQAVSEAELMAIWLRHIKQLRDNILSHVSKRERYYGYCHFEQWWEEVGMAMFPDIKSMFPITKFDVLEAYVTYKFIIEGYAYNTILNTLIGGLHLYLKDVRHQNIREDFSKQLKDFLKSLNRVCCSGVTRACV